MAALRAGIDLGGTKMQAIVVDAGHEVLGQARRPTPTSGGPAAVVSELAAVVRDACADAKVDVRDLAGVGLGSPGSIVDGTVGGAGNLPDWPDTPVPVAAQLADALGTDAPVRIGNDVDVATNAEFELGAAARSTTRCSASSGGRASAAASSSTASSGTGAARPASSATSSSIRAAGAARAGARAAWRPTPGAARWRPARGTCTSRRAADRSSSTIMEERGRDRLASGVWSRAVKQDDELALELIEEAVQAIGTAAASAVNLLDPEAVVIGGGMGVRFGEPMAERIRAAMLPHLFRDDEPPAILLAGLGDLGGALGAALLVSR